MINFLFIQSTKIYIDLYLYASIIGAKFVEKLSIILKGNGYFVLK